MVYMGLMLALTACAIQAVRSTRLLISALWLAGASALLSTALFALGAHEIAVVELSVGAGLVTVLLVYTIAVAGEEAVELRSPVPWLLALALVGMSVLLLAWLALPLLGIPIAGAESTFKQTLWQQRSADVLAQIVLLFLGAMGVLGLVADERPTTTDQRTGDRPVALTSRQGDKETATIHTQYVIRNTKYEADNGQRTTDNGLDQTPEPQTRLEEVDV